jgi:hypothetical protein
MLYDRDKDIIKKLIENEKGKYQRFNLGDIEYIIDTIKKCAYLEDEIKKYK